MRRLNPYSNGSYFLTELIKCETAKCERSLNPYSNGSYFLTSRKEAKEKRKIES